MDKKIFFFAVVLLFPAVFGFSQVLNRLDLSSFEAFLDAHLEGGRFGYEALKENPDELERFIERLQLEPILISTSGENFSFRPTPLPLSAHVPIGTRRLVTLRLGYEIQNFASKRDIRIGS